MYPGMMRIRMVMESRTTILQVLLAILQPGLLRGTSFSASGLTGRIRVLTDSSYRECFKHGAISGSGRGLVSLPDFKSGVGC